MSDLVACPTCRSTLRLPADAATVRCPKCKTTLQVIGDSTPPPAAPPPPPPPPKPLPFAPVVAKPKSPPPPPPPRPNAVAKPAGKKKHRPEVVDEEWEADQAKAQEVKAEAEKKRQMHRELDEMDRAEEKEDDRYDEIDEHCLWGRRAMQTLKWSLLGYLAALTFGYMILVPLYFMGVLFNDPGFLSGFGGVLSGVSLFLTVATLFGTATGFVLAIRGPKQARHTAVIGVVMTGLQLVFVCGTVGRAIGEVDRAARARVAGYPGVEMLYVLLGTGSNLQAVGDAPTRYGFQIGQQGTLLNNDHHVPYSLPWLNVLCGVFEFTRLLLVCQLTQRYAELGKSERVAMDCGRTVGRVFGVMLIFALFRGAASAGFDWFPQDNAMWYVAQLIHLNLFLWAFIIIGVRLLTQFRVTSDAEDVLIADRVASKYDTFNEV